MAKINKVMSQSLSGKNPQLTVDLDEMFGSIVPDSTEFRQKVGQAILDKIVERSHKAEFLNPPSKKNQTYSEEYAHSLEFKAYGKSKNDVNLTQTGDMLSLMDIIKENKNSIVIGWTDKFQAQKAHGHITGNVGVERDFLGLPLDDIEKIADAFRDEIPLGDLSFSSTVEPSQDFIEKGTARTFLDLIKSITGEE